MAYLRPPSHPASAGVSPTAQHPPPPSLSPESSSSFPFNISQENYDDDFQPTQLEATQSQDPGPSQRRTNGRTGASLPPPHLRPWLTLNRNNLEDAEVISSIAQHPHERRMEVLPSQRRWAIGRYGTVPVNSRTGVVPPCPPDRWINDVAVNNISFSNWHAHIELVRPGDHSSVNGTGLTAPPPDGEGTEEPPAHADEEQDLPTAVLPPARSRGGAARAAVILYDHSANGTFVNGVKMPRDTNRVLHTGDEIAFCHQAGLSQVPRKDYAWTVVIPRWPDEEEEALCAESIELQAMLDRYDKMDQLGSGSFAFVHKVWDREENMFKAMKTIDKMKHPTTQRDQNIMNFRREISILRELNHPNIVKFYDSLEIDRYIYIIMELIDGGEYLDYIIDQQGLQEQPARIITASLMQAVAYLGANRVAHRDLKPENVMMTAGENPVPKIVDFGLAKMLLDPDEFFATQCGTPAYLAPEVVVRRLKDPRGAYTGFDADVFSLGVITFAALANSSPFWREDPRGNLRVVLENRRVDIADLRAIRPDLSENCYDFIAKITRHDPAERMKSYEALQHPWIRPWAMQYPASSYEELPANNSQETASSQRQHLELSQRTQERYEPPGSATSNGTRAEFDGTDAGDTLRPQTDPSESGLLDSTRPEVTAGPETSRFDEDTPEAETDAERTREEHVGAEEGEDTFSQEMQKMRIRTPARHATLATQAYALAAASEEDDGMDISGQVTASASGQPSAMQLDGGSSSRPSPPSEISNVSAPPSGAGSIDGRAAHERTSSTQESNTSSRKRLARQDESSSLSSVGDDPLGSPTPSRFPLPPTTPQAQGHRSVATVANDSTDGPRRSRRLTGQPPAAQISLSSIPSSRKARSDKARSDHSTPAGSRPRKTPRIG